MLRVLALCLLFIPTISSAGDEESQPERIRYFSAGAGFGSNTAFFGRSFGIRTPYLSSDFSYKAPSGFYSAVSAIAYYQGQNTELDLTFGWEKMVAKRCSVIASYSRFIFSQQAVVARAVTSNLADAYFIWNSKLFYTTVGGGAIFGGTEDFFLSATNSRYYQFDSIFQGGNYLALEPLVGFTIGTRNFTAAYLDGQVAGPNLPFKNPGKGKGPGNAPFMGMASSMEKPVNTSFAPLNLDFSLPVTFNYRKFYWETRPIFTIPLNVAPADPSRPTFFITSSAYFVFPVKAREKKS